MSKRKSKYVRKGDRKCRVCGHLLTRHVLNIANQVICTVDGCHMWLYCNRKEKEL